MKGAGTFGDINQYGCLKVVEERLSLIDRPLEKRHYERILNKFNNSCSLLNRIVPRPEKQYLLTLVRDDYREKFEQMKENGFDPVLISHIKTFINSKVKRLIKINRSELSELKQFRNSLV